MGRRRDRGGAPADRARPPASAPARPYAIQAAIAALHDTATGPDDTDWCQIAGLYGALARETGLRLWS